MASHISLNLAMEFCYFEPSSMHRCFHFALFRFSEARGGGGGGFKFELRGARIHQVNNSCKVACYIPESGGGGGGGLPFRKVRGGFAPALPKQARSNAGGTLVPGVCLDAAVVWLIFHHT